MAAGPYTPVTPTFGSFSSAAWSNSAACHWPELSQLVNASMRRTLPAFIKPPPEKMDSDDVKILMDKEVFVLPPESLQMVLLGSFIEFVYPFMPVVDLPDLLRDVLSGGGGRRRVSLFLYYAIMFAGATFVDAERLKRVGLASRMAARKALFRKAQVGFRPMPWPYAQWLTGRQLLYHLDYETDALVLVQGLLLMTYWYKTPDDPKDASYWLGNAISLAQTAGLHRNPADWFMDADASEDLVERRRRLRKRVWWACFIRDRHLGLCLRRPTKIRNEDFNVPMLERLDFDVDSLAGVELARAPPEWMLLHDKARQEQLADMCVQMARLCLMTGPVLEAAYTILPKKRTVLGGAASSVMVVVPREVSDRGSKLAVALERSLHSWAGGLPESCRYRPLTAADAQRASRSIAVHRNLLHMMYHATLSALVRPLCQQSPVMGAAFRAAAASITSLAAELQRVRIEKYLPTIAVTAVQAAMISHAHDVTCGTPQEKAKAATGLTQCENVLTSLGDMYAGAACVLGFFRLALRRAQALPWTPATPQLAQATPTSTPPPPPPLEVQSRRSLAQLKEDQVRMMNIDPLLTPAATGTPYSEGSEWEVAAQDCNVDFDQFLTFPGE